LTTSRPKRDNFDIPWPVSKQPEGSGTASPVPVNGPQGQVSIGVGRTYHFLVSAYPKCDGFEYVFDWMAEGSEERIEIETTMSRAEEMAIDDGNEGEFSNYSFRKRKEIPGLQCVDCVSWVAYRFALFSSRQTPLHPLADLGWKDFGGPLHRNGWLGAITIERHNLKKWYEEIASDPKNMETFVKAEERRLARQARPRVRLTT
jgi:hypothetical protein